MDRSKKVMSTGKIFAVLDEICQGLLFNCKPCSDIDLSLSSVHKAWSWHFRNRRSLFYYLQSPVLSFKVSIDPELMPVHL